MCVCVSMLPVSVFECRDPQSSARAKGPSSISQELSANHFLRIGGLKKNKIEMAGMQGGRDRRIKRERGRMSKSPCRMAK